MVEFKFQPLGKWPRAVTPPADRVKRSPFRRQVNRNRPDAPSNVFTEAVPVGRTFSDLKKEIGHLGVDDGIAVIQAGFKSHHIRLDGQIRGDAPNPQHPGIVLSFTARIGGRPTPLKFVCDHFANWKDNLRAIALTLERLRLADLYGVTKSGEQYTGWRALPAPLVTPPPMTLEYAAQLMATHSDDFGADLIASDGSAFSAAYRQAVKKVHPDAGGGDDEAWEQLQQAKTVLEAHYQSR